MRKNGRDAQQRVRKDEDPEVKASTELTRQAAAARDKGFAGINASAVPILKKIANGGAVKRSDLHRAQRALR